jgi:PAS domain S-box-containing protein
MSLEAARGSDLRRSLEELRSCVEHASIGLHWVGPDGIILWANAADHEMLGYARDEYVGQPIGRFHADPAVLQDIMARLTRGERLKDVEARLVCKDGSLRTVLIDSSVLWDQGRFIHTQCFTRDVTDQRRDEGARHQLAAIVESSDDAIISTDLSGTILTWNMAAERMYGYTAQDVRGRPIHTLIPPELAGQEADILARVSAGERVAHFETRRRRKDGAIVDVSLTVSPIRDAQGAIVGASKIARDITRTKRALEAARQAEATSRYLAEVIESAETMIMGVDLEGRINTWNQGAVRMFGYEKAEILGRPLSILAPADRRDEPMNMLARVKAGESIAPYETVRLRKDGTSLRVSIKVSPVRGTDGGIVGCSAIIRDVTAEHAAKEALREAKEALTRSHEALEARVRERTSSLLEAVAQLEEFSYTVSHDLRAPLRAMQAYSKALLSDFGGVLGPYPEATRFLNKISSNASRLDRMILDVLTFSRMARSELRVQRVGLDRLVRELIEHYPDMQEPRASVRVAPLADVIGHEPSLTQALSNLLTNAIKFVPAGARPEVRLWTEARGSRIRVCVQDNGIGIAPEYHHRLFKMFERIHPDLPYEGTGVGLAIVRRAAERMGGKVGVESSGAGGSLFWLELGAPEAS